jgi:hypothetical protein
MKRKNNVKIDDIVQTCCKCLKEGKYNILLNGNYIPTSRYMFEQLIEYKRLSHGYCKPCMEYELNEFYKIA